MGVIDFMLDASYFSWRLLIKRSRLVTEKATLIITFFNLNVMKMTGQAETSHRSGEKKIHSTQAKNGIINMTKMNKSLKTM